MEREVRAVSPTFHLEIRERPSRGPFLLRGAKQEISLFVLLREPDILVVVGVQIFLID